MFVLSKESATTKVFASDPTLREDMIASVLKDLSVRIVNSSLYRKSVLRDIMGPSLLARNALAHPEEDLDNNVIRRLETVFANPGLTNLKIVVSSVNVDMVVPLRSVMSSQDNALVRENPMVEDAIGAKTSPPSSIGRL